MAKTYWGIPTPKAAMSNANNGISQVVINLGMHLPAYGWQAIERPTKADLIVQHAGEGKGVCDVAVCHGLYPTGSMSLSNVEYLINARVIADLKVAKAAICPSEWVADILRRDMHLTPHVVHWGVNLDDWRGEHQHKGYVLWNKNRDLGVCSPHWLNAVAAKMPQQSFVSTFGDRGLRNLRVIGRQHYKTMRQWVKEAAILLATTLETGDIGSREALAAGVPVVGFDWGAVRDIVQQNVNGILVPPGNVNALAEAIQYVIRHRDVFSHNAKVLARNYGWDAPAQQVARILDGVHDTTYPVKVSVIIPCHNYAAFVGEAIQSVAAQQCDFPFEIIVVDDGSEDGSWEAIQSTIQRLLNVEIRAISQTNQGVAAARDHGIEQARGQYIVCLDADDMLDNGYLQVCANALDDDPLLGMAFSRMRFADGRTSNWLTLPFDIEKQLSGEFSQIPTCAMFRRGDWARVNGYRQYMAPAEDADLFTRILWFCGRTAARVSDKPLFVYRMHTTSVTAKARAAGHRDPFGNRYVPPQRPIAAPVIGAMPSNPSISYDRPLVGITIVGKHDILSTIDDLEKQDYPYWIVAAEMGPPFVRANVKQDAPLQIELAAGTRLGPHWLTGELQKFGQGKESIVAKGCCGGVKKGYATMANDGDFVLAEYISNKRGKLFIRGQVTHTVYGYMRPGDKRKMDRRDIQADSRFRIVQEVNLEPAPMTQPPIAPPTLIQDNTPFAFPADTPPAIEDDAPEGLTVKELSEQLRISESSLRSVIVQKGIEPIGKQGRANLYDINDFD